MVKNKDIDEYEIEPNYGKKGGHIMSTIIIAGATVVIAVVKLIDAIYKA